VGRSLAAGLCATLAFVSAVSAGAQEFHLFDPAREDGASALGGESPYTEAAPEPLRRLCVVIQCATLPVAPAPHLFNTGSSLWSAASLFLGIVVGAQGPITYGIHDFSFTDEGFFAYTTYAGGSDKASHGVVSATISGLLFDAYRLNGLSENQSFALAFAAGLGAGLMVEIGDGLTPYGFSAQDLTADAFGALAGAMLKRGGFDDVVWFQLGKVPSRLPDAVLDGRTLFGIDYTREIYAMNFKTAGIERHLGRKPGFERFFQTSFVYLTKGYGYEPVVPTRYQEIGVEIGLDFPEILRAVGVSDSTWWGDTLLRAFQFFRIPYTQIGAYYNFKSKKWYGAEAPYRFY
jgi:hypothetical protein